MSGSYTGARTDRRALQEWKPLAQSPDADIVGDLPTLGARSRNVCREAVKRILTQRPEVLVAEHPLGRDVVRRGLACDGTAQRPLSGEAVEE